MDHKKFEFMLEKLDLVYKPRPLVFERTDNRRKMGEKLATLLYHEIKVHKMLTFRDELEKQQPVFLRKKAKILAKIMQVGPSQYLCRDCGFSTSYKNSIMNHIEAKHVENFYF